MSPALRQVGDMGFLVIHLGSYDLPGFNRQHGGTGGRKGVLDVLPKKIVRGNYAVNFC